MFRTGILVASLFLLAGMRYTLAQTSFYDQGVIQKIDIYFSQPNWDYQLDTSKFGADGYVIADWVAVNGVQYDSVGVKYKGNSSYDSTYLKNPLHIELNQVINQSYQGVTDIKLGNSYGDPSMIREVLAYDVLSEYMDCPRSDFAQLYINGSYIGLYSNTESISKQYCSTHFSSSSHTFFKCNPVVTPGPTTKSNLRYIPLADSTAYFNYYELKSNYGWNELVALCDAVTNSPATIGSVLDIDRVIWMLAFNSVLVNLDSYTGVFCQNYYLYKDDAGRFSPIVWDLNMSFGGFPFVGSGASSMGSLTVANMQQLDPLFHSTDPYWPLINAVLGDASLKRQYIAHARTINNEQFANGTFATTAGQLQTVADTAAQSDVNAFFAYSQFQNAMVTDYPVGSYVVPGISNLMNTRTVVLQNNPDFQSVPPTISGVTVSNSTPSINDVVQVTAAVNNAGSNSVFIGFRNATQQAFARALMYDDGLHGDGAAGDNVFGADLTITDLITEYYIYAENAVAGMFAPERAEHEFYSIQALSGNPNPGEVVINEFLAWNVTDATNEAGIHADWIELYNNTNNSLALYGTYLTDDFLNPTKFSFPPNTFIPANGFLMLWADEDPSTPSYLHCNFKLANAGEQIMLSNGTGLIIDSVSYGQQADDISWGRCPTGTGPFGSLYPTSFDTYNCSGQGIGELLEVAATLYPNPADDQATLRITRPEEFRQVVIRDLTGREVISMQPAELMILDLRGRENGLYTLDMIPGSPSIMPRTFRLAIIHGH